MFRQLPRNPVQDHDTAQFYEARPKHKIAIERVVVLAGVQEESVDGILQFAEAARAFAAVVSTICPRPERRRLRCNACWSGSPLRWMENSRGLVLPRSP